MKHSAIEHRAAKVSLVNGLSTILAVSSQLISVPVCLHYWGKETYGGWLALLSAFMFLRGFDAGYSTFVGNKLNYLYHHDTPALHEHLSSAAIGIVAISVLQMTLVASALAWSPLSSLLGISADGAGLHAQWGLVVLMISWVLTGSYLGIVHRLLIPAGLMYQAAWWAMAFQLCQFVAIMTAASLRLNMLETSALFALAQLGIYVASALYVRRALPEFSPWLRGAAASIGLRDLRHSLLLTTSNLIQQGATNGIVLLISFLGGASSVPVFTTVRTMTNLWTSVTTILSTPLLPDVVRLYAKREVQKLLSINQAYWVVVGAAVDIGALVSFPCIPAIYARWTAHAVPLDGPLLCCLLASVVVANAGALMALHINGINSLRIVLAASATRAVSALGVGALGFGRYGLASFGFGILAGEVIATLITTRHFVTHEVRASGTLAAFPGIRAAALNTGIAVLFFLGAAVGWWPATWGWAWFLSLTFVVLASLWGWKELDPELRTRLKGIPLRLVGRPMPPIASSNGHV